MPKQMYRVSVTALEKYRRWMAGTSPFDTEAMLMEVLRGIFVGNDLTATGDAFHRLVERPGRGVMVNVDGLQYVRIGKIALPIAVANKALAYHLAHRRAIHEASLQRVYETAHYAVQVVGRLDICEGILPRDMKMKFKPVYDPHEYLDSCQWRFYLDMLDAPAFVYDVFVGHGFEELVDVGHTKFAAGLQVDDPVDFTCYRYDDMRRDLMLLLSQFMEFAERRDIFHLLKPQPYVASAQAGPGYRGYY